MRLIYAIGGCFNLIPHWKPLYFDVFDGQIVRLSRVQLFTTKNTSYILLQNIFTKGTVFWFPSRKVVGSKRAVLVEIQHHEGFHLIQVPLFLRRSIDGDGKSIVKTVFQTISSHAVNKKNAADTILRKAWVLNSKMQIQTTASASKGRNEYSPVGCPNEVKKLR